MSDFVPGTSRSCTTSPPSVILALVWFAMGSGDKDRHRKRSRSRSRSRSSSDSSRERRHKHKEKKHKKDKKHKKHKKRDADIDDAKVAAAKAFLEQHLQQTAGGAGSSIPAAAAAAAAGGSGSSKKSKERPAGSLPPGVAPLTADDYFERSGEFTAWLQELQHTYFNELTTEQSHAKFAEFVAAWNSGALPLRFYQGLAAAPLKRTSHNWQFKAAGQQGVAAGQRGMAAFMDDQQQQRADDRAGVAAERRTWRREQKEALDELLPRATGGTREARVEARMARREEAKAREGSPDISRVVNIMGGDDSFAAAKAREAQRQEWRAKKQVAKKEELSAKLSAAAQAEAAKMEQFRQLLAAQGGAITIAKRDKPA